MSAATAEMCATTAAPMTTTASSMPAATAATMTTTPTPTPAAAFRGGRVSCGRQRRRQNDNEKSDSKFRHDLLPRLLTFLREYPNVGSGTPALIRIANVRWRTFVPFFSSMAFAELA
jgi:hypothetical protein